MMQCFLAWYQTVIPIRIDGYVFGTRGKEEFGTSGEEESRMHMHVVAGVEGKKPKLIRPVASGKDEKDEERR
jgi:hypothetical protein